MHTLRKTLLTLLLLLPLTATAQDSADAIVERYLRLLNIDAFPKDSMLVLETTITFHGTTDTFSMRRWYVAPEMLRVEVRHGDTLQTGLCTNGTSRYREYSLRQGWWNDLHTDEFNEKMQAYDFRGPLYDRQRRGITIHYDGVTSFNGQRLLVVGSEQKNHYLRQYLFEERSGLLVVVLEKDTLPEGSVKALITARPLDYKVTHEYLPIGACLVPSQESFMRNGLLTILNTTARVVARDNMIFNQD